MVKIVSRKSDLAIIQAEYVAKELRKINKNIDITFVKKETQGDIDQLTSLSSLSDIGVFTNDIRKSLLEDESDIAKYTPGWTLDEDGRPVQTDNIDDMMEDMSL